MTQQARTPSTRSTPAWLYLVLGGGLVLMVIPFLWMVISSVKPESEVRAVPPTWWPESVTSGNYASLFSRLDFPTYFANSTLVALAVTVGKWSSVPCLATPWPSSTSPASGLYSFWCSAP